MKNCPNCNAPIEPYKSKCEYCGTYYFDFSGIDMSGNKPCYVKIGNVTAMAIPRVDQIEYHPEYESFVDIKGRFHNTLARKNITIQANFDVLEYKEIDNG